MSSSDRNIAAPLKRIVGAAGIGLLLVSAGCQVRPLYATGSGVDAALKAIEFSEADNRIELEVRNNLIFLAAGGAGEPANPEYEVDLKVKSRNVGVLVDGSADQDRAGRIVLKADFTLTKKSTGQVLKTGHRSAVALVDFNTQEYAKIRATRDAENRAARELAELIRADLAAWLGR
jgi:LPS-assembly lipoprotein